MDAFETIWNVLGVEGHSAPPVWIVGSGMTRPNSPNDRGVPGTREFATAYLRRLKGTQHRQDVERLLSELEGKDVDVGRIYRDCSAWFQQPPLNGFLMDEIRRLVLSAFKVEDRDSLPDLHETERLEDLVWKRSGDWFVRPGLEHLAAIIRMHPKTRNHAIFTTNFDPLISVAFQKAGQLHARVNFEKEDYPLTRVTANAPVVYHVHGYWTGSYTLNSSKQIEEGGARRRLARSIGDLLAQRNVIVLGYGGWDDVMMLALKDAVAKHGTRVFWCARSHDDLNASKINELKSDDVFFGLVVDDVDGLLLKLKNQVMASPNARDAGIIDYKHKYEVTKSELEQRIEHGRRLESIEENIRSLTVLSQSNSQLLAGLKGQLDKIANFIKLFSANARNGSASVQQKSESKEAGRKKFFPWALRVLLVIVVAMAAFFGTNR